MHRSRKFLTTSLVAGVATVFAGCFSFVKEDTAQQSDVMADVAVTTKACATTILGLIDRPNEGPIESLDDYCVSRDEATDFYFDTGELGIETVPLPGQVLLSYRVSKGAEAPDTLTAKAEIVHFTDWWTWRMDEGGGGTGTGTSGERPDPPATRDAEVTFTRSDALNAEIVAYYADPDSRPEEEGDSVDIVGDDQRIVSYVSDVVPGAMVGDWKVTAPFGLPSQSRPYAGPFNHVSMVGWRAAMTPELEPPAEERRALRAAGLLRGSVFGEMFGRLDPNRSLDCGFVPRLPDLQRLRRALRGVRGEEPETDLTLCPMPRLDVVDDEEEGRGVDYATAFRGDDTVTRDLDLRGGSETFVEQGKSVGVPYSLVGAGPAGGRVDVSATVSPAIGGLDVVKGQIDFPGTGTSARSFELKIPESAPARTYEVVVRAASGGKERTARTSLVVLPKAATPQAQPPAATVAGTRSRPRDVRGNVYMDRQGFIRFTSTCGTCAIDGLVPFGTVGDSAKAAQAVGAHRLLRVARGKGKGKAGVRTKVRVKLFPKAQRTLRKGRRLNGVIVFRSGTSAKPVVRKVVFRTKGR